MGRRLKIPMPKLGITNRVLPEDIKKGGVVDAVNVDISDNGSFRRRGVPEILAPFVGITSAFYSAQHGCVYYVASLYLYRASLDALNTPIMLAFLSTRGSECAFVEYNGYVYCSAEGSIYQIDAEGNLIQGIPALFGAPKLSTIPGGSLAPGTYHVVCTSVDPQTKREGGTSSQSSITLDEVGGIVVDVSTLAISPSHNINVYVTPIGSEVFYLAHTLPYGLNTVITSPPAGKRCSTLNEDVLRGGNKLAWVAGRLFTTSGEPERDAVVTYSSPFNPLMTSKAYNYLVLSGSCRLLNSAGSILYIGDDRGVWAVDAANIEDTTWVLASPHLAVSGSGVSVDGTELPIVGDVPIDSTCAAWLSEIGLMVGMPNGTVRSLSKDLLLDTDAIASFAGGITQFGTKQLIFLLDRKVTI